MQYTPQHRSNTQPFIQVCWRPRYGAKVSSKVPSSMRSIGVLSRGQPSLWLCRVRAHSVQRHECLQGSSRVAMGRSRHTMQSRSGGGGGSTGTMRGPSSRTIRSSFVSNALRTWSNSTNFLSCRSILAVSTWLCCVHNVRLLLCMCCIVLVQNALQTCWRSARSAASTSS
jgi:hypothetical protein